jgi:hypothetical protein
MTRADLPAFDIRPVRVGSFSVAITIFRPLARKLKIETTIVAAIGRALFRDNPRPLIEKTAPKLARFATDYGMPADRVADVVEGILAMPEPDAAGWRKIVRQARVKRTDRA